MDNNHPLPTVPKSPTLPTPPAEELSPTNSINSIVDATSPHSEWAASSQFIASKQLRNIAFGVIAIASLIWLLKFAQAVIVPLLLGIILSYSLRPAVEWLSRVAHMPRPISAAFILTILFGGIGAGLWNLREDVTDVVGELPKAARMIREFASANRDAPGIIGDIHLVAREIDRATATLSSEATSEPRSDPIKRNAAAAAAKLETQTSTVTRIQSALVEQLGSLLNVLSTAGIAGLLAFFLLCAGTEYRKKLLQIVGQSLSRKKTTLTILNDINTQIQYFLVATAVTNIVLGLTTWALFAMFGIERALLWGIVAALLRFIPYLGVSLFLGICFVIGLVSLNSFWLAFYLSLSWLGVQFVTGFCLNTYIQSRAARINSAALFVGFLIFGWLWGGWGLIVAAPVLAALKAVTSRIESLKDVSTLLS